MNQRKELILLAVGLLAGIAVWEFIRTKEPTYQGMTLSEWFEAHPDSSVERANAIRAIGKDAIPVLLNWISYEPLSSYSKLEVFVQLNAPEPVLGALNRLRQRRFNRSSDAVQAFEILGTNTAVARTELARIASLGGPCASRNASDALMHLVEAEVASIQTNLPAQP